MPYRAFSHVLADVMDIRNLLACSRATTPAAPPGAPFPRNCPSMMFSRLFKYSHRKWSFIRPKPNSLVGSSRCSSGKGRTMRSPRTFTMARCPVRLPRKLARLNHTGSKTVSEQTIVSEHCITGAHNSLFIGKALKLCTVVIITRFPRAAVDTVCQMRDHRRPGICRSWTTAEQHLYSRTNLAALVTASWSLITFLPTRGPRS